MYGYLKTIVIGTRTEGNRNSALIASGSSVGSVIQHIVEQLLDMEASKIIEPNIAILEQAETQALMNTAQEQLELQSATPGTEGELEEPGPEMEAMQ